MYDFFVVFLPISSIVEVHCIISFSELKIDFDTFLRIHTMKQ